MDIFVDEGEVSDNDPDDTVTDPDQTLSEDQNYRETMRGIRSYMGWTDIPDIDTTTSTSDDNPFAGPRTQPTGKVSVKMPTDQWLCKKMGKLNLTLVEGYPSRSSEAGGLLKDQFIRPARSQQKWYGLASDPQKSASGKSLSSWNTDSAKVNSTYSRIARAAGIASTPPPSRQISQDNLRRWEKAAREASTMCNQAAAFNRCLNKVQDNMRSQLKAIKLDLIILVRENLHSRSLVLLRNCSSSWILTRVSPKLWPGPLNILLILFSLQWPTPHSPGGMHTYLTSNLV